MSTSGENLTLDRPIQELYKAFHLLNEHLFQSSIKEPAILIQNQGNRRKEVLGWCTIQKIWGNSDQTVRKYEINLTAEYLNREVTEVIGTLLHEMVHLFCLENDIQDTSRSSQYHNKKFKQYAEQAGFHVEFEKQRGWAYTSLTEHTKSLIESFNLDPEAFVLKRYSWSEDEEDEKPKKRRKKEVWTCPKCEDPEIKSSKILNIICGKCMARFVLVEKEESEEDNT